FDEPLMARHVNEAEMNVADGQVGEADVDRDAPLLLFLQTVGVNSRQRLDERSLAVIDVAGRADDNSFHDRSWDSGNLADCEYCNLTGQYNISGRGFRNKGAPRYVNL